jgi:hypothetical protein
MLAVVRREGTVGNAEAAEATVPRDPWCQQESRGRAHRVNAAEGYPRIPDRSVSGPTKLSCAFPRPDPRSSMAPEPRPDPVEA